MEAGEKELPNLVEKLHRNLNEESFEYPLECIEFLERAIRLKDYDISKAIKLVKSFKKSTKSLRDMLEKYDPRSSQVLFSNSVFSVLKSRDASGRQVIVARPGLWNPSKVEFDHITVCAMLLFSWISAQTLETQQKGLVFIFDLTNFGVAQLRGLKITRFTVLLGLLQDSAPGRIKALHFVLHTRVFGYLFRAVKPFIKEKLTSRIHFHGDDLSNLHQHLKPDILPRSLGGTMEEHEAVDQTIHNNFCNEDRLHTELIKFGFPRR